MPTPDLFPTTPDPAANLLPHDGALHDYGRILTAHAADRYLQHLLTHIPWQHDRLVIFGKAVTTAREIAWYGDRPFNYRYSGSDHHARPWDDTLRALKTAVQDAAAGGIGSVWVTPASLMTDAHWKSLSEVWGPR